MTYPVTLAPNYINKGDRLKPGQHLANFEYLQSSCGRFRLINEGSGHTKLFQLVPKVRELWSAFDHKRWKKVMKYGGQKFWFCFQGDGNIVQYAHGIHARDHLWTAKKIVGVSARSALALQRDGNLVAYSDATQQPTHFWSTGTEQDMSFYDEKEKLEIQLKQLKGLLDVANKKNLQVSQAITKLSAEVTKERAAKEVLAKKMDLLTNKLTILGQDSAQFKEIVKQQAACNNALRGQMAIQDAKLEQLTRALAEQSDQKEQVAKLEERFSKLNSVLNNLLTLAGR